MGIHIGADKFFIRVAKAITKDYMREAVKSAQDRLRERRIKAADELGDWEEWRNHGEEIRRHTLENLDYYLLQLTGNVEKNGGHVYFAKTENEVNEYILEIIRKKNAKKVVKSKSMVTEEISLNKALEDAGCKVVETDLAEFILQTDDHDPPSHIVVPCLHKNRDQIRGIFHEKLGYQGSSVPEEMTAFVRGQLRKEFLTADVGITGCNFAVAESGSISIVANEGNARMSTTLPKTMITVMGMERIVPTWEELDIMVSLLTRAAVGQRLTSYISGFTGPRGPGDMDGPEEFHLVIVDNGRSDIIGTEFQSTLNCIRCAACINVCPVYRHIGGHAYGSIYPGPIGAILTPLLGGYEKYKELPYASSLCGACTEVCPVKIPIHKLLILHRRKIVEDEKMSALPERVAMRTFRWAGKLPRMFRIGTKIAPVLLQPFTHEETITKGPGPLKPWTDIREFPPPSRETFHKWYSNRSRKEQK
jgi:L-lactate dehydrogenase complex protein LldF